jgi:DNA-binding SARP family transcriptional activator/muconolactone delta-isomerase
MSMTLRIFLIGQFKLQADDAPIELPSRPAQSLLAYLALHAGVVHRREKLAGLFWHDATETNARSYLRQALWRIRKAFEAVSIPWENYLDITDISVSFRQESDHWLDTEAFLDMAMDGSVEGLQEQTGLYTGELLPGFFDDWVLSERERLQAAYHQKMDRLLDELLSAGRWHEAVNNGEQWIRLGYAPEPAYRALMRAYAGMGDQAMASATYQRCIEALDKELGLDPSPETRRLYDQIFQGELAEEPIKPIDRQQRGCAPEFLTVEMPEEVDQPLFVSRDAELERLKSFLANMLEGTGRIAFITGEAGSGKTALVNEFTRLARESNPDLVVVGGNCNAHTGIGDPYLPFREILELLSGDVESRWAAGAITSEDARRLWDILPVTAEALAGSGADLVGTLIPGRSLVERAASCVDGGTPWLVRLEEVTAHRRAESQVSSINIQSDLFEQYTRVLQAVAREVPLILVLDDLQWADPGSISLLFHLGRHLAGYRILVMGSYRTEEVAIGREGKRHPLAPVISELQRIYGDMEVNVDQAERRAFLEALIDTEPNDLGIPFRDMLFRQTNGHPLFTLELLRGLQERGDLVLDDRGLWVEGPTLEWEKMPARVEAVINERIERLPDDLKRALRVACVEGEVFTAEVVARVQGVAEAELLGRLSEELERKHRLLRAQSIQRVNGQLVSSYRFQHIQIQKYLYSSLNKIEQVRLHDQVGAILEELYKADQVTEEMAASQSTVTPIVQLAWHFQQAGAIDKAVRYLWLAGERSVQLSAYQEALAHIELGLALLMSLPDSSDRASKELRLQLSLGKALKGAKGMGAPFVETVYNQARELCQKIGDKKQLWMVMGELAIIQFVKLDYQAALELIHETQLLAQEIDDPIMLALSQWMLGFVHFGLGEFVTAREHFKAMIEFYHAEHHQQFVNLRGTDAGLSAMAYDACALWCLGYPDQAERRSLEAIARADEFSHPFTLVEVVTFAGCLLNEFARNASELKQYAERVIEVANIVGLAFIGAGLRSRGEALLMLGQTDEGNNEMQKGLTNEMTDAAKCTSTSNLTVMAYENAKAGDTAYGLETIEHVFEEIESSGERFAEAEALRVYGEILLMMGKDAEAETQYKQAIAVAQKQKAKMWELRATGSLARLWQRQGKREEAREQLAEIYNWFTEGFDTRDLKEAKEILDELQG